MEIAVVNAVVLDVETTISNKGNPFDETNKLCYIGIAGQTFSIEYDSSPYGSNLRTVQSTIDNADLLIGFNIKFDLHWIARYGLKFNTKRIWDCQVVHFILTGQTDTYPSLNGVCEYYGLESKLDIVAEQYWKNGINTPDIPKEILEEYLLKDLELTELVYKKQVEELRDKPLLRRLVNLHNQDLLVLQEMEFNGLLYDEDRSNELAEELDKSIQQLDELLFNEHSCSSLNLNSVDHLSAFLYGGSIRLRRRVPCGVFKTGARAGEPKEKWEDYEVVFDRLVKPLKGSELAKEGLYSTDEATLRSLRGSKKAMEIIELLLKRAELEKRVSTYYRGLLKLREESKWEKGKIHGQLNQCVARTGRLSSSRPNLQNFDGEIKQLFYSRFP
jgi:DNA polymerase I-like protein with 3'-5' exonuclease and polymerase domains